MAAGVTRPTGRSVLATFDPAEAELEAGQRYAWRAESSWPLGATCSVPAGCAARVPERGEVTARVADPPPPDQLAVPPTRVDARDVAAPALDLRRGDLRRAGRPHGAAGPRLAGLDGVPATGSVPVAVRRGARRAARARVPRRARWSAGARAGARRRLLAPAGRDGPASIAAIAVGDLQPCGRRAAPRLGLVAGRIGGRGRRRPRARRGRRAHADRAGAAGLLWRGGARSAAALSQPRAAARGGAQPGRRVDRAQRAVPTPSPATGWCGRAASASPRPRGRWR